MRVCVGVCVCMLTKVHAISTCISHRCVWLRAKIVRVLSRTYIHVFGRVYIYMCLHKYVLFVSLRAEVYICISAMYACICAACARMYMQICGHIRANVLLYAFYVCCVYFVCVCTRFG